MRWPIAGRFASDRHKYFMLKNTKYRTKKIEADEEDENEDESATETTQEDEIETLIKEIEAILTELPE